MEIIMWLIAVGAVWIAYRCGKVDGECLANREITSKKKWKDRDNWDEDRMDIIGQNGNDGTHYDK